MSDDELIATLIEFGDTDDDARAVLAILTGAVEPPPA